MLLKSKAPFNRSFRRALLMLAAVVFCCTDVQAEVVLDANAKAVPRLPEKGQSLKPPGEEQCAFLVGNQVHKFKPVCLTPPPGSKICTELFVWMDGNNALRSELGTWFDSDDTCSWITKDSNNNTVGETTYFSAEWGDNGGESVEMCACERPSNNGCFAPGTKITMADGSQKAVEDIAAGDVVLNPSAGSRAAVKRVIQSTEHSPLIELSIGNAVLRVTSTHPMVTQAGPKKAVDVSMEDSLQDTKGELRKVTSKRELPVKRGQQVFNFELDPGQNADSGHLLLSDGIVSGDLTLQLKLNAPQ